MGGELRSFITQLERVGQAVLVDDDRESVSMMQIRPRQSLHGGGTAPSTSGEEYDVWKQ